MRGRRARWVVIALFAAVLASSAGLTFGATTARGADAVSAAVGPMAGHAHDLVLAAPNSVLDRVGHAARSNHGWPLAVAVLGALSALAAGAPRRAAIVLVASHEGLHLGGPTRTRAPPCQIVPA